VALDDLLSVAQYSLPQEEKQAILTNRLRELTLLHFERSDPYRRILSALSHEPDGIGSLVDVPMLPVGLFKSHTLRSIPEHMVFKVVTSSGTTGTAVSRVYLDAAAAHVQTRALAGIMTHWLGPSRLPMIVSTRGRRWTSGIPSVPGAPELSAWRRLGAITSTRSTTICALIAMALRRG
jgi:phenylacetate-coenzyme A ligase PaaK-like adenylate-forming protein